MCEFTGNHALISFFINLENFCEFMGQVYGSRIILEEYLDTAYLKNPYKKWGLCQKKKSVEIHRM